MTELDIQKYLGDAQDALVTFLPNALLAIVVFWVGMKIIKKLKKMIELVLKKSGISDNIRPFLTSIVDALMKIILIFAVVGIIGVNTSSFVALIATAGFAVGMALQGSLANFASGILVLVFKPYITGDWIKVDDKFGKVDEIQLFNTIIETPGHKTLIVPNSKITDGIVTNFSRKGFIRLELTVTMPYEESFPRVKSIIEKSIKGTPLMLETPLPEIGIESYDSHSIVVAVRPYCKPDDFWAVSFEVLERIKGAFHENNIKVAYSEGVELGSIGA